MEQVFTVSDVERTCQSCVMWGPAESGGWGSCCRLSCAGGVLSTGEGFVRTAPDFGCNEFAPGPEETLLVLEGPLRVFYHEGWAVGDSDVLSAIWAKWEDTYIGEEPVGKFRVTIERLE